MFCTFIRALLSASCFVLPRMFVCSDVILKGNEKSIALQSILSPFTFHLSIKVQCNICECVFIQHLAEGANRPEQSVGLAFVLPTVVWSRCQFSLLAGAKIGGSCKSIRARPMRS